MLRNCGLGDVESCCDFSGCQVGVSEVSQNFPANSGGEGFEDALHTWYLSSRFTTCNSGVEGVKEWLNCFMASPLAGSLWKPR